MPKVKTRLAAGAGGGGGAAPTVMVATPWMDSVAPEASVAVAVSVRVAEPTPTAVIIAPFGVAGSGATVKTVGSELT